MTAALTSMTELKSLFGVLRESRPSMRWGKAVVTWGRNGYVHPGAHRGKGPSIQRKTCGDNVGRDHLPAGAGSNLRRLPLKAKSQVRKRVMVRRMSSYERR